MGIGGVDPGVGLKGRSLAFGGGRTEIPLPSDATNTLFVEGLPANCTRREVARILMKNYYNCIFWSFSFIPSLE